MIVATANIDVFTGEIYCGKGHGFVMMYSWFRGFPLWQTPGELMGFLNDKGEWLSREEAAKEAAECGQVDKDNTYLISEDLWDDLSDHFYKLSPTDKTKQKATEIFRTLDEGEGKVSEQKLEEFRSGKEAAWIKEHFTWEGVAL